METSTFFVKITQHFSSKFRDELNPKLCLLSVQVCDGRDLYKYIMLILVILLLTTVYEMTKSITTV